MGDDCRIRRSQKLPHNERRVSWSVVMMQDLGVVSSLVWMFAPDVFPQLPRNVAIQFSIHRLSCWNKFLMHDAFNCLLFVHVFLLFVHVFLLFVHVFLLLSMYSYCSSMYSYCCLCNLIVVYVFLLFVHVFLLLSMYSYCCLCILIVRPFILIVIYVHLLLSMYS